MRPSSAGFEIFFVRRSSRSAFMPDAFVFPGGRIEPGDLAAVQSNPLADFVDVGLSQELTKALYLTALRESVEEAGIWCGGANLDGMLLREQLRSNEDLFALVTAESWDSTCMVLQARWITPEGEGRRFDTLFFVAVLPADATGLHDSHEVTDSLWMTPAAALEAAEKGSIYLPPPTSHTVEWFSRSATLQDVRDSLEAHTPWVVMPHLHRDDVGEFVVLPGDPLHPEAQKSQGLQFRYRRPEQV